VPPDPGLMERLQDGRTNILFVGRISPQKKQDDLVGAFQRFLVADPSARLILVGPAENSDPYAGHLRGIIDSNGLGESVIMAGSIPDSQLAAYYRTAHLFWSMSEHEGFCVPLLEAMWFDIPIVAYRSTAVPETLGDAALMFTNKSNLEAITALAFLLVQQPDLRNRVIQAQRKRRVQFLPDVIRPLLSQLLARMLTAKGEVVTPEINNNTAIGALH
jgi:glycosyltransferase involved in cell wall biosynthesis